MINYSLKIKNLTVLFTSKSRFIKALDNCDLSIPEKSFVGIVGASGSGKTVLLSSISGIIQGEPGIISGSVEFDGKNILKIDERIVRILEISQSNVLIRKNDHKYYKALKSLRKSILGKVSLIFQNPQRSIDPFFTIKNQFEEIFRFMNYEKRIIYNKTIEWLNKIKIHDPESILDCYPYQLSGGMLQRICIAMAMITNPVLLLADEITESLDVRNSSVIINLLKHFNKTNNTTILFVTHNLNLIRNTADYIYVMYSGQIVEFGKTEEIFNSSKTHPYTEHLLNSRKLIREGDMYFSRNDNKEKININNDDFEGCCYYNNCSYKKEKCMMKIKYVNISDTHIIKCNKYYG